MEFQEGDRVVCIKVPDGNRDVLGKFGVVIEPDDNGWTQVKWEDFHDGWGEGDSCWSCPQGTIRHLDMENV